MVSVQEYEEAQSLYDNKVRDFVSKFKGLCNIEFQQIKDYVQYDVITTVIIYYYESFEIKPDTKWEELVEFITFSKFYNESDPVMIATVNEKIIKMENENDSLMIVNESKGVNLMQKMKDMEIIDNISSPAIISN